MPGADELPLAAHLFLASQQELPIASCLLDLAENLTLEKGVLV